MFLVVFRRRERVSCPTNVFQVLRQFTRRCLIGASPFSVPAMDDLYPVTALYSNECVGGIILVRVFRYKEIIVVVRISYRGGLYSALGHVGKVRDFYRLIHRLRTMEAKFALSSPSAEYVRRGRVRHVTHSSASQGVRGISHEANVQRALRPGEPKACR